MVHPQMKVKNAELPIQIHSMEDAPAMVTSVTLLLVKLSAALSPIMYTMGSQLVIVIITTSK